jgi:hypothetical protein
MNTHRVAIVGGGFAAIARERLEGDEPLRLAV